MMLRIVVATYMETLKTTRGNSEIFLKPYENRYDPSVELRRAFRKFTETRKPIVELHRIHTEPTVELCRILVKSMRTHMSTSIEFL